MKQLFRTTGIIILILSAILIQFSCHENVLINSKVSPSNNAINVYSTSLAVLTYVYYSDSAVTSTTIGGLAVTQAVGSLIDPYFGTMTGATYFQVIPELPSSDTFTGNTIDSAILILPYGGATYGDTFSATGSNITQTYQAFYMLDSISLATTYFSNTVKAVDLAHPLSAPTTVNVYHLRDSMGINVLDANYPGLRIKLNLPVFKSRLFAGVQNISATSTNPAQDFMNAFNGICIRVADNRQMQNAIPYFQLDGVTTFSQAGVIVYYHPTGTVVDSDNYSLFTYSNSYCAHFNNITRSYNHYPVSQLIQQGKANTSIVALQNQPGASIDVVIPGIKSLPAGIINKAEIQFTLLPSPYNSFFGTYDTLFPPETLYPTGIANASYPPGIGNGVAYNVADRYPVTSTSPLIIMDGFMHGFVVNSTTYQRFTVDVPREVMYSIAQKNDTLHFQINGTQDFYGAFHMVAGGGSYPDSNYRAKLVVTYSKLNN